MMNVSFSDNVFLILLISIPALILLHIMALKFTNRRAVKFANFEAMQRISTGLVGRKMFTKNILLLVLRCSILFFMVLALAGTTVWYFGQKADYDFVLAIDASGSMLADDFKPNRLEAAKNAALMFADSVPSRTKVGVVSFSGTTFIKRQLIDDRLAVKSAIKDIQIEYASGTAIGDTIITTSNMFEKNEKPKVLVLLTDGQNTVGVSIEEAVKYANENYVVIHTIGIATQSGGKLEGIGTISKLDEETLSYLAEETGGKFYKAQSQDELNEAYDSIVTKTLQKIPLKLSLPSLILALILIFFEWVLINTRYRTIP